MRLDCKNDLEASGEAENAGSWHPTRPIGERMNHVSSTDTANELGPPRHDEAGHRRDAHRAVGFSAIGLALTGAIELALAIFTGSVALLGDALHNLSDVSTSAVVFWDSTSPSARRPRATIRLQACRGPRRPWCRPGDMGNRCFRRC